MRITRAAEDEQTASKKRKENTEQHRQARHGIGSTIEKLGISVPTEEFQEEDMPEYVMKLRIAPNIWDCKKCPHCCAYLFPSEFPSDKKFNFCCSNGTIRLTIPTPPPVLRKYLQDPEYLKHSRGYNNRLSFFKIQDRFIYAPVTRIYR